MEEDTGDELKGNTIGWRRCSVPEDEEEEAEDIDDGEGEDPLLDDAVLKSAKESMAPRISWMALDEKNSALLIDEATEDEEEEEDELFKDCCCCPTKQSTPTNGVMSSEISSTGSFQTVATMTSELTTLSWGNNIEDEDVIEDAGDGDPEATEEEEAAERESRLREWTTLP